MTLDDDVAAELDRLRRARGLGFKEIINDALRRGLCDMTATAKRKKPFHTQPFDPGCVLIDNLDNIAEVLALIEGEAFR